MYDSAMTNTNTLHEKSVVYIIGKRCALFTDAENYFCQIILLNAFLIDLKINLFKYLEDLITK